MTKKRTAVWLAVGLAAAVVAGCIFIAFRFDGTAPDNERRPVQIGETGRGLTYCNQSERYCLDYQVSWAVNETVLTERDDKGGAAQVTKAAISAPDGKSITISPQFGGRPGGSTCFMEKIQYNPSSECLRQTYISSQPVQVIGLCKNAKEPYLMRVVSGSPSQGIRYLLRYGHPRKHDYKANPIVVGREFISEGFDYDNLMVHCGRQAQEQPLFPHLRFDVAAEGVSSALYDEPTTQEAEAILKSFRFY